MKWHAFLLVKSLVGLKIKTVMPKTCQVLSFGLAAILVAQVGGPLRAPGATNAGVAPAQIQPDFETRLGAIVRGAKDRRQIALLFTGHEFAEGADSILTDLGRFKAKASFFLTGDFLQNTNFASIVRRLLADGHYLGPHSDKHLLYCSWDKRETLVSNAQFKQDLEDNLSKIEAQFRDSAAAPGSSQRAIEKRFGTALPPSTDLPLARAENQRIRYFLPPFEHHNEEIAAWTQQAGLTLINFTPGTRSNADYTGEADKNFVASKAILESILNKEQSDPKGLNGFLLLLHLGAGPGRADKFHPLLGELLDALTRKGYQFVAVTELLAPRPMAENQVSI